MVLIRPSNYHQIRKLQIHYIVNFDLFSFDYSFSNTIKDSTPHMLNIFSCKNFTDD